MAINLEKHSKIAMEAALDKAKLVVQSHFTSRQTFWKALAASTILQRQHLGFSAGPILLRSDVLKEHLADEMQIEGSGNSVIGSISPSRSATPAYGDKPISEYAASLDKTRPFYDLKDTTDVDAVVMAFKQAFIESFNR